MRPINSSYDSMMQRARPSSRHRHQPVHITERGFSGPVTHETAGRYRQNPAAHGNIEVIATCRCGARRRTLVNQHHVERGRWVE